MLYGEKILPHIELQLKTKNYKPETKDYSTTIFLVRFPLSVHIVTI